MSAKETQDTFKMNVNDPRFSAVYECHEYAVDPSNPQYKWELSCQTPMCSYCMKENLAINIIQSSLLRVLQKLRIQLQLQFYLKHHTFCNMIVMYKNDIFNQFYNPVLAS